MEAAEAVGCPVKMGLCGLDLLVLGVHRSSELQPDAEPPQSAGVAKESLEGGREAGRQTDGQTDRQIIYSPWNPPE